MEMGAARKLAGIGMLALALAGCGKVSKDNGKVIANVGGEKITERSFQDTLRTLVDDPAKAQDLLTNPALRGQRNQLLGSLVNQKALLQYARAEGLDKDPRAQIEITQATATTYFQIITERLMPKAEPTDEQLKAFYDDYQAQLKLTNPTATLPPYDQVKAQLPGAWKQRQAQLVQQTLLKQLNEKYPVTFDEDYRPPMAP
jgi:hypothetical protein